MVDCLHCSVILSILISFTDRIWTNLLPLLTISVLGSICTTGDDVSFAIRHIFTDFSPTIEVLRMARVDWTLDCVSYLR